MITVSMADIGRLLVDSEEEFQDRLLDAERRAAERGVDVVRAEAPVDTGYLRESVHASHLPNGSAIDVDAPYALYVEYGTSRQPPNPFMRRSMPELAQILVEEYARIIRGET